MTNWFEQKFYGNSATDWLLALAIAFGAALLLLIAHRFVRAKLSGYARSQPGRFDDLFAEAFGETKSLFLIIIALYFGTQSLDLPMKVTHVIKSIAIIALLMQAALWINRGFSHWLSVYLEIKKRSDTAGVATVSILGFIGHVGIWAIVALMILDNLGFNITALVASLGVGGIAVALAVQNILGDIFASLSIALDKPFTIGDFIVVDEVLGTVEYIGLKTTRLRSLSGEQIILANGELLKNRIRNYKRMFERRVLFSFGVMYQISYDQLKRIPTLIQEIINAQQKTRFDRVHFMSFGDSSLNFEVVYYVLDSDYNIYMDIQQTINLAIFNCFEQEKINFAYPTRTVHLYKED